MNKVTLNFFSKNIVHNKAAKDQRKDLLEQDEEVLILVSHHYLNGWKGWGVSLC